MATCFIVPKKWFITCPGHSKLSAKLSHTNCALLEQEDFYEMATDQSDDNRIVNVCTSIYIEKPSSQTHICIGQCNLIWEVEPALFICVMRMHLP